MKYLLSLAFLALVMLENVGYGQNPTMRGEVQESVNLEETNRSLQSALLAEEIEEAGFDLDVEEGFEEEWEEDMWVGTDDEEIDALYLDIESEDLIVGEWEEVEEIAVEEEWEMVEEASQEEFEEVELIALETELAGDLETLESEDWTLEESVSIYDDLLESEWEDEIEEVYQEEDEWEELFEEWEIEDMEYEEDLDLMEAIFNAG